MACLPQRNLSWPRQNIFTKVNVMKVRNLFLWQVMGGSTISCVVMVFCYLVKKQQHSKLILHISDARRLSSKHKYPRLSIIAMDETSVWNGMVSNTATNKQGVKSVCLKITGHEKCMISGCLGAKVDGTKMKSFVVFLAVWLNLNHLMKNSNPEFW